MTQVASSWLLIGMWGEGDPKVIGSGSAVAPLFPFSVRPVFILIRATLRALSTPRFGQRCQSAASG